MILLDVIILALILIGAVSGLMKGFVKQFLGLLSLLLGGYFAYELSGELSKFWTSQFGVDLKNARIIFFIAILIIIYILTIWLSKLLGRVVKFAMLNWANRLMGMLVGTLYVLVFLSGLAYAVHSFEVERIPSVNRHLETSVVYPILVKIANYVYPYMKLKYDSDMIGSLQNHQITSPDIALVKTSDYLETSLVYYS